MAITGHELLNSRGGSRDQREFRLRVRTDGSPTSDLDARAFALANTPLVYDGLWQDSADVQPDGKDQYLCVVSYTPWEPTEEEGPGAEARLSFDTTGTTTHITVGRGERRYKRDAQDPDPPDLKGAIDVGKRGVNGCDVIIPGMEFSLEYSLPRAAFGLPWVAQKYYLTGSVNNAAWKGFAQGEVLFKGCRVSGRRNKDGGSVDVAYLFAASPNLTNVNVGGITITKRGWEYAWSVFEAFVDEDSGLVLHKPRYTYVDEVYPEKSFALLGIGT